MQAIRSLARPVAARVTAPVRNIATRTTPVQARWQEQDLFTIATQETTRFDMWPFWASLLYVVFF
jgi:hypothetical protein